MMKPSALALAVMALAGIPGAEAATATGTLSLSITISATCSVVSASAINFGMVTAIGANIDQTSTLTVNCSTTTPYNVGLSVGGGSGATYAARLMSNGANAVTYSLYRDAGRTLVWGETIGTDTVAGTGTAANQTITIYARVPPQTVPPPGAYTDNVTITITY
jgi:spore coat protein U-like protein